MTNPVRFVAHTNQSIETLKTGETNRLLDEAIETANKLLEHDGVVIIFIKQLSPTPPEKPELLDARYNMLLGIQSGDQQEPIDMIDMKALDEVSIKSKDQLATEISRKAKQHLAAKKIKKIIISSAGSKLDTRSLKNHTVFIDADDFLLVDGHRLATQTENHEYWVLRTPVFRSYTISRLLEEGNKIRLFDDYDLVRENLKGMLIDVSKVHHLAKEQLVERSRRAAENYNSGEYFLVERDVMTHDTVEWLNSILSTIPFP